MIRLGSQYETSEEEDNDMYEAQVDMNAKISEGEPEVKEVKEVKPLSLVDC
jgi:hypothetical protein